VTAELAARRTTAAAVLADYRAALASAPLGSPPGREWKLRLADALGGLLDVLGQEETVSAQPSRQDYTEAARAAIQAAAAAEQVCNRRQERGRDVALDPAPGKTR
jgi:hypothetical protein